MLYIYMYIYVYTYNLPFFIHLDVELVACLSDFG